MTDWIIAAPFLVVAVILGLIVFFAPRRGIKSEILMLGVAVLAVVSLSFGFHFASA